MTGNCQHCKTRRVTRPRGLCDACYKNPRITVLYPSKYYRRGAMKPWGNRDPVRLPQRQEGQPAFRCLWCTHYKCDGPLKLCADCQAWYDKAQERIPQDERIGNGRE